MQLILAGCIGLGLVWGWLLVLVGAGNEKRPWRARSSLALITLATALLLLWQFGRLPLFAFALAAIFTGCIHFAWRRQLLSVIGNP